MVIGARQRNVALLVAGCYFMENLDGTIVTTAAPRIAASLRIAPTEIALVVTAYLITLAALIPLGGWMVARLGNRRVFLAAIFIFTIASLLCALSTSFGVLVAMRVLQGVGGAMMTPVGRIVALANVEKRDLLRIISFIVWPALIAPIIAPLAGGLITTYASWRWLFLINVPLGAVAFVAAIKLMPLVPAREKVPLDWTGLGLTAVGLGGLTYTAHLLSVTSNGLLTGLFAIGSVLFIGLAIRHLLRAARPLLELHTFRIRTFRAGQSGLSLYFLVVGSVPFLLPLLFETVFGWSPIKSGVLVIFVFIGNVAIKPATTFLLTRFGFRAVLAAATGCVGVSMIAFGLMTASTPVVVIATVAFLSGVARSTGFTAYISLTLSDVPENQMRDANVLASMTQQLGSGLAIAVGAVALHVGGSFDRAVVTRPGPTMAFTTAFFLLAAVAFFNTTRALHLPHDAGDSVRPRANADGEIEAAEQDPKVAPNRARSPSAS